uniref:Uncharacterized protein n=1 Tax=Romanomermis culicivorax TaxID=13658 RepID=A0A915HU20_ROMCU
MSAVLFIYLTLMSLLSGSTTMAQCTRDEAFIFDSSNDLLDIIHDQILPTDQFEQGLKFYNSTIKNTVNEISDSGLMFNVTKDDISQRINDLYDQQKIIEETKQSTLSMINNPSSGSDYPPTSATDHEFFLAMPLGPTSQNLTFAYSILKFVPKQGQNLQLNGDDLKKLEMYTKTKAILNFEEKNAQVIGRIREGKQKCSATLQEWYDQCKLQIPKT